MSDKEPINATVLLDAARRVVVEGEQTSTDSGFIVSADTLNDLREALKPWDEARNKYSEGYKISEEEAEFKLEKEKKRIMKAAAEEAARYWR